MTTSRRGTYLPRWYVDVTRFPISRCHTGAFAPRIRDELRQPVLPRLYAERRLLEQAAAVHIFFDSERYEVGRFDPRVSRYLVAPTGVDVPDRMWEGTGNYIAWIGRYAPDHKGLDVLLDALASLAERDRPQLQMRGLDYKGGRSVVEALVDRAQLGNWVTLGDPVYGQEKIDFLCACRAYVHPSRWESHSMALSENLALGVPTIVSQAIHAAPYLDAHHAALAVELTFDQLAAAIASLRVVGQSSRGLSLAARRFVAENWSWPAVMSCYLGQLRGLLAVP